jgi:hypothetical protein
LVDIGFNTIVVCVIGGVVLRPCYTVQFFLQCNSTLERCKIAKYESSLHSADVFSTYRKFFTDFIN